MNVPSWQFRHSEHEATFVVTVKEPKMHPVHCRLEIVSPLNVSLLPAAHVVFVVHAV
jgi:hypothetical protein